MQINLVGACGLYCGACDHYLSNTASGKHLLERKTAIGIKVSQNPCGGCKVDCLDKLCKWCRECSIRKCVIGKNLNHCRECKQFPCEEIEAFNGIHMHKREGYQNLARLSELGISEWLKEQEVRWSCRNCGSSYSFYELECFCCKSKVEGLYPDKR